MTQVPDDLRFTAEHEWIADTADGTVRFGITDYAQDSLGDIVYVDLPKVGQTITAGQPCGEVESTKSVSEIYAPVSGEVVAVNAVLSDAPETVNSQPYGEGWMVEVRVSADAEGTLDAAGYRALIGE
ncbi:MAG: glycine cleavage system protein GcvH [Actinomycetota bacterium]|jgi:glycine cleavage system H protein